MSGAAAGQHRGMPAHRRPIPALAEPLSRADALARGIPGGRLDSAALEHPFWGVVQERGRGEADPFRRRCLQAAARMPGHQFFSHGTALRLWGAPAVGPEPDAVHVSALRPEREPRRRGIRGHRLQERDAASVVLRGMRVEHPVRAWRQGAAGWSVEDAVIAGDFLVAGRRPLASVDELWTELSDMGAPRAAVEALRWIRVGAESPRESVLRLVLGRAGLPEPEVNVDLHDAYGRLLGRGDLVYRQWRVLVEYDGRQHAESVTQFERDADRWHAFAEAGWEVVRVLRHHLNGPHPVALDRVRAALTRGGWSG